MTHAAAHAAKTMHGFIQMHLAGAPDTATAQLAATAVNGQKAALNGAQHPWGVQNADPENTGTVLVYVEFNDPPAPWDPTAGTGTKGEHTPKNADTPAHARVQALRTKIAANVNKPDGTPFFNDGLSHNWCCYGDQ